MANYIEWHLPASKPLPEEYIIIETLDGEYIVSRLESFSEWSERVVKWAYLPQEIDAKIENILSDLEYFKEENEHLKVDLRNATEKLKNEKELNEHRIDYLEEQNEALKKHVEDCEDWHNKYLDLLGKYHNEHQRDAFIGKRSKFAIDDCCGDIRDAYIRACIKETDREIFSSIAKEYRKALYEEAEREAKEHVERYAKHDELVTSGELYPGEFDSRSDNSDGDEHLTADDICELHESYDAGSDGKISRDEIREIVLECMRKEKERAADDGK